MRGLLVSEARAGVPDFLDATAQVKTELVLRALRPEYAEDAGAQALLDLYFQVSDDMDEADRARYAFVVLNGRYGFPGAMASVVGLLRCATSP